MAQTFIRPQTTQGDTDARRTPGAPGSERLPDETDSGLSAQQIRDRRSFDPERLDPGFRVHHVDEDHELWDPAERFVYSVFRTSGFCDESPREWVEETQPWRPGSVLHVITDGSERIMGVARTIIGTYESLPVNRFTPEVRVPSGALCEIGSLAVRPSQRGLGVANELHRVAFQHGIRNHVDGFCFIIDRWMFDFFGDVYGLPVRELAAPREFMGGVVVPTGMWMPEMLERIARIRPKVYQWSVEGLEAELWAELDLPIVLD